MGNSINSKLIVICIAVSLCISVPFFLYHQKNTVIVFCNVGQGDGIYIRIKDSFDIVIDTGPDNRILKCLGTYMPFNDRTIDMVIVTHPQEDHIGGLAYLLSHYEIKNILMSRLTNTSSLFKRISYTMRKNAVPVTYVNAGDKVMIGADELDILWPSRKFQEEHITTTDSNMHLSRLDDNDFSVVTRLKEGLHTILFTGDASPSVLNQLPVEGIHDTTILKVPHHGSINGLSDYFLELANPQLSVISVGKNNKFHHPSKEIIHLLETQHRSYLRTDLLGTIILTLYATTVSIDYDKK